MAFTSIKNGVVTKAKNGGKGYTVEEQFKRNDGSDGKTRWQIWFDEATELSEGQRVNLSGVHSDKVAEFTNNEGETVQFVERSLNKVRLSDEQPEQGFAPDGGEAAF